ncbi:DUF6157 family protein [Cyclobacterium sp. 1_MG-2023]|uniref:DUF6157 family protein n=1 Tax=Cyclobacterium sp. 1_MG-2023 TaxID=3062681 RepID=UPI0026E3624E|nr:DUF6157 family protein [Cyclobacterium sp. 1_MG-2023]MDO6437111.1 DUF6157 family protein [Cyclobacterium sp. 1_MG-2023]
MKGHSTNYFNTFIEVAADCRVEMGEVPPHKGNKKSVANLQYEMISEQPYQFTSDELLFAIYALRKDLSQEEYPEAKNQFFSKGQACLRASPLTKRYGFGIHSNKDGKVALFGRETVEYEKFTEDQSITKIKAMRSKKP